jgi:hypothetical protein
MYGDWGWGFLLWHSAYFSICVWISLYLMQAPRPRDVVKEQNMKITIAIITIMTIVAIALIVLISVPAFT